MKPKFLLATSIVFFVSLYAQAQSYQKTKLGITARLRSMNVEVQFYSPKIVRILKKPAANPETKESLSVIKHPEQTNLVITDRDSIITLKSSAITVLVNLRTGKVSFNKPDGEQLLSEKDYGAQLTTIDDVGRSSYAVRQAYVLDPNEVIYGLGQLQNGKLNQRNQKVYLQQENMKVCIPFLHSTKGYGLFWDNYSPTTFTDNPEETAFDSEIGDYLNYYFMFGGGADGVVCQMRDLTGQAPMMPLWVYGFSQSRERYKTQHELINVIKKYRTLKVPLDGIVQDWQYWGNDDNWNAMSFNKANYPSPRAMIDSIHEMNAHLFIVSWPCFGPKTDQYQEFKKKKMFIDFDTWPSGTKPYDVYNPAARDIYWNYLNKGIFSLNSDAWWLDSTEPDHINTKPKDFDQSTYLGSYRSVQNAFPLQHVGGVYDHQRQVTSAKRVVLLTRSAFAGQQRYGSNTWSGDIHSTWQTLKNQIPAALNFSLTGLPYWNADIGGFYPGDYLDGKGAKNPGFQELYVRWMQFATFTPMMRAHGTSIPREIYEFGKPGDWVFDVQEKFIKLRYRLLPYLYSTAWQVTNRSGSIMRPLYADFPKDKSVYENSGEFMFGQSILVAPVTDKGAKTWKVYLPNGTLWYDFWTGETLSGNQDVIRETPMDILPLYVKAGAIIPWGPDVQYATEKKWSNLDLRIYPGQDGEFKLYEDENDNYNYEKGQYSEITFKWNDTTKTLTVSDRKGSFPGMLNTRQFNIILVSATSGSKKTQYTKSINYNGKKTAIKLSKQ